jgi:hypothetical protein
VEALSVALEHVADAPGDRGVRQQAVENVLAASRTHTSSEAFDPTIEAVFAILTTITGDILTFAGLTPSQASHSIRSGVPDAEVPQPPATPRLPFGFDRRRRERRSS